MSPKLDQPKSDLFNYFMNTERWSGIVAALKLGARKFFWCFFFLFLSTPACMNSPFLFVLFLPSSAYFNSSLWFMSVQISLQISRWLGSLCVIMLNEMILLFKKDDWLGIWVAFIMVGKRMKTGWKWWTSLWSGSSWNWKLWCNKKAVCTPTLLCLQGQEAVNNRLLYYFVMLLTCVKPGRIYFSQCFSTMT